MTQLAALVHTTVTYCVAIVPSVSLGWSSLSILFILRIIFPCVFCVSLSVPVVASLFFCCLMISTCVSLSSCALDCSPLCSPACPCLPLSAFASCLISVDFSVPFPLHLLPGSVKVSSSFVPFLSTTINLNISHFWFSYVTLRSLPRNSPSSLPQVTHLRPSAIFTYTFTKKNVYEMLLTTVLSFQI